MIYFFLFLASFCSAQEICFFAPPKDWQCVRPKEVSNHIQVGFLGQSEKGFRPSVNLATEEIDVSLKEYLKAVRELHGEMNMSWRDLGEFSCLAGKGHLTEIGSRSPFGDIKILQMIFVKDKIAYILTGAVLSEEFAVERGVIVSSMHSLNYASDLFSPIASEEKRNKLKQMYSSFDPLTATDKKQKEWKILQVEIEQLSSLGSHWQFLALQEGHEKIFGKNPSIQYDSWY